MSSQEATDSLESLVGPGESNQLSILFYDIVNSTGLSRRIGDPESWLELQDSIHRELELILTDHGGYRHEVQGDGAVYLFGLRSIFDPAAAAHAALAVIRKAEELNRTLPLPDKPEKWTLQFRVIITSGVIAARPKSKPEAAGDALILPSRLKCVCNEDKIVIDSATRERLGHSFHLTALEPQFFKGIDSKVEAFELVALQPGQTKFDARITPGLGPLVGRNSELAQLSKQWELARAGQGQVGFIVGNAGIGKSRLALAVSQLAAENVKKYQCSEVYRSKALYPFLDGLRRDAKIQYDDNRENQIAKLRTRLGNSAAATDELCEYMLEIRGIRDAEGDRKQDDLRERTLQLICEQLVHAPDSSPCLLLIEDLQWIDPTSRELLTTIIQLASGLRLFVLVTSREDGMIGPLGDNANVYPLGPLSEDEGLEVIGNAFQGIDCPPTVAAAVAAAIIKRTEPERLPLYLEELAYSVRQNLAASNKSQSVNIPVSVEICLQQMLHQLSGGAKLLAQVASVIGPTFSRALLMSMRGSSMYSEQAFRALEESRFISPSKDPHFEYRFRHDLLRDSVYQSILPGRRQEIHQEIAVAISASHHHIEDQMPEFVAHHWREAGNAVRAVEYLSKAFERADMRSAVKEAFGHFHQALDLIDKDRNGKVKQFENPDKTELMLRVRGGGIEAAVKGYSAKESQGNWSRILKLSKDLSPERFNAHLGLAASIYVHGKLDEALEHGRKCLDMAARTGSTDQALHAHRILCEISFYMGEFAKCCDYANDSIVLYSQEDHQRLIGALGDDPKVLCLMYRALSHWILGRADLSIADCKQGIALSAELGHPYSSAQAWFYASWLYALMRDRGSAEFCASTAIKMCEEGGFDFYGGLAHVIHGWAISVGSDATAAIDEISQGINMVRGPEADICLSCFLPWQAEAYLSAGKLDEGITIMREADEFAQEKFYEGERWRVKGDLHSANARSKAEGGAEEAAKELDIAKECYAQALKVAHKGRNEAKAFELRTMIRMCKNGFCDVEGLQPLVERMDGEDHASEDHDLNEARKMLGLST